MIVTHKKKILENVNKNYNLNDYKSVNNISQEIIIIIKNVNKIL